MLSLGLGRHCRSTLYISIFFFETTWLIGTKLSRNGHWMFFTDFIFFMWISHSKWLPGPNIYIQNGWNLKKNLLWKHMIELTVTLWVYSLDGQLPVLCFSCESEIWPQKKIVLRNRSGNASINRMSHYLDAQIQACTNEDPSVSGVQTLRSKVCIGCNGTRNHVSSRTTNGNVILFDNTMAWFWCEDTLVSNLGSGVMVLHATFNDISVISWSGQFYWRRKPKKIIYLSQVADKLYHIMSNKYTSPR